jgi:hypothetical protein
VSKRKGSRKDERVLLLQVFLQEAGDGSLVFGSMWHPLLDRTLSASERARLESSLDSVGVVIADHLARVMSQEIGTHVTANVRSFLTV